MEHSQSKKTSGTKGRWIGTGGLEELREVGSSELGGSASLCGGLDWVLYERGSRVKGLNQSLI